MTATLTATRFTVAKQPGARLWDVLDGDRVLSTHKTKAAAQFEAEAETASWEAEHDVFSPIPDAEQIAIAQNAHSEDPVVIDGPDCTCAASRVADAECVCAEVEAAILKPYSAFTADEIAAMDTVERLTAAKVENLALRAWKEDGSPEGVRPATPIIDWMANPAHSPAARKASKTGGAPRATAATFDATTVTTHVCSTCGTDKPVTQFPTISGKPGVRGCRCRQCRDAKPTS